MTIKISFFVFLLTLPSAIGINLILFGSKDVHLYYVNILSGEEVWKFKTQGWVHSSPSIINNMVVFGSTDKNLYCLDVHSGNMFWKFSSDGLVYSSPFIAGQKVYFENLKAIGPDKRERNLGVIMFKIK